MFLPKDTSSIKQQIDEGIILATKICTKKFLKEILVILDVEEDEEERRGQSTLENLKS